MSELLYYDLKGASGVAPGLATQICREIGRRIVAGSPPAGELVSDETTFAERFGVSKSVIREAIKLLVAKGMVEVKRGSGTRVRDRSNWMLFDDDVLAWHQSAKPSPDFLRQLMDIRLVIEPKAACWAASVGTPESHAAIEAAQQRMEQEKRAVEDFVMADAFFHRAILHAAGNEFLRSMEGVIFSALLTSIRLTNNDPRKNEDSIPFHREVCDAILARDAALAEQKMSTLLTDAHERMTRAVSDYGKSE